MKCHLCHMYTKKIYTHPTLMHPVIVVGPFTKWGFDFMMWHPPLEKGHNYIIVLVDYFTKWVPGMPTFTSNGLAVALFMFNHVISKFELLREIFAYHNTHFQNSMMV